MKLQLDKNLQSLQQLSQFLHKKFLEFRKNPNVAKLFRSKLLSAGRWALKHSSLDYPGYIAEVKKSIAACEFMHHGPETRLFSSSQPKYAVAEQEGILITGSHPPQYGTHHSTYLFYQLCESLVTKSGKIDDKKFEESTKKLDELYGIRYSDNNKIINFIQSNNDILNLEFKQPHPGEILAQDILTLACLEQKISHETQLKMTDQAKEIILQIPEDKIQVLEKMEAILKIRNLIVDTPTLRISFGTPSFISEKIYISRDSKGTEISISGAVRIIDQISMESLATLFNTLLYKEKIQFISKNLNQNSWILNCKNFTPSEDLVKMRSELASILSSNKTISFN